MKKFTERTWRNEFREEFHYQEDSEHMPDGPKWEEIEDYIQKVIDKGRRSRTGEIIEMLEATFRYETNSLKKAIRLLRTTYGYMSDLIKESREKRKKKD